MMKIWWKYKTFCQYVQFSTSFEKFYIHDVAFWKETKWKHGCFRLPEKKSKFEDVAEKEKELIHLWIQIWWNLKKYPLLQLLHHFNNNLIRRTSICVVISINQIVSQWQMLQRWFWAFPSGSIGSRDNCLIKILILITSLEKKSYQVLSSQETM